MPRWLVPIFAMALSGCDGNATTCPAGFRQIALPDAGSLGNVTNVSGDSCFVNYDMHNHIILVSSESGQLCTIMVTLDDGRRLMLTASFQSLGGSCSSVYVESDSSAFQIVDAAGQ